MGTGTANAEQARRKTSTVDAREIERFAALADAWWEPEGKFQALHKLNPTRIAYIRDRACAHFELEQKGIEPLAGLRCVDLGSGGGLLAEPLTRLGANVVGVDAAEENVAAAARHAEAAGLHIDYRHGTAEDLAASGAQFDVVLAMEIIEHVADAAAFFAAAAALVRPGGVFVMATLNRTLKSIMLAIVGAEYVLGWLPRGTHDWERFLRPSEVARHLRGASLNLMDVSGVSYNPLTDAWQRSSDTAVNYMAFAVKKEI
jgi:2-polyprenyl-6-hydroxyphenyl methylase/3-demethylubiquinone-9 3-methyltransferase